MKNTLLLLTTLLFSLPSFSQDCNIGNEDSTNFKGTGGNFSPDFLLGVGFTLAKKGVLKSINLLGKSPVGKGLLAVYKDSSGKPSSLVAAGTAKTMTKGINSWAVTPTELEAGKYWIMSNYEKAGAHTFLNTSSTTLTYYGNLTFGTAVPQNISSYASYNSTDFTYYMEISCGGLSTLEASATELNVYPNPVQNVVHISGIKNNTAFQILDLTGRTVKSVNARTPQTEIDLSDVSSGNYVLMSDGEFVEKLIVE